MYDVIFVDFFGVLDNSRYDSWLRNHGYERSGKYNHLSELTDVGDMDMPTFYKELGKLSGLDPKDIESEFQSYDTVNRQLVDLLTNLKNDYRVVLLSNASAPYLRGIIDEFGIKALFDEVIISGEVGMIKPHKDMFEYALNKMQVDAQNSIFIDDHQFNVDAACSLGIHGLLYVGMNQLESDLSKLGIL
jgi:HAD superfamily hydrolase (TIGR01509 family)